MPLFSRKASNTAVLQNDLAEGEIDGERGEVPRAERRKLGSTATVFASGAAMFSDGYSNAAIGPVNAILTKLYPTYMDSKTTQNKSLLNAMAFAGMVLGQLSFGYISDKIGRRLGMFICTGIICIFSFLSACSAGPTPQVLINCLIAFRFLNGIGIGGEYPCGSVTAAEATENHDVKKGRQQRLFIWATNTMLDIAFPTAWFVALVLNWIWGEHHMRATWRGTLGLGTIPPLILTVARIWMQEPEAYKKNSMRHTKIPYGLILRKYWLRLAAVSVVWFLYDWIVYPFGQYAAPITDRAIKQENPPLYVTLGWSCLINAFYVPGTIVGSFLSDWIRPKYALITGLLLQAIFGFALSGAYDKLTNAGSIAGFAVMYGLFLAFGEVGPGNNLGLLASKGIGPTACRGQLYGIAAAIGKVGAFIGSYTFPQINDQFAAKSEYLGNTGVFWVGSALAVASAIITLVFIPDVTPDFMVEEDLKFRAYLEEHGFDTSTIGEPGWVDPATLAAGKEATQVDVHDVNNEKV